MAVTWYRQGRAASLLVNENKETLKVSVDAIDLPPMTEQYFKIGRGDEIHNSPYYKGYIRDVKLFEKALSNTEVKSIKGLCAMHVIHYIFNIQSAATY